MRRDSLWLCSSKTITHEIVSHDNVLQSKGIFDMNGNFDMAFGKKAIISIYGTLFNHQTNVIKYIGGRVYSDLIDIILRYTFNEDIEEIVLLFDTPGGEACRCEETVSIFLSCAARKKITSLIFSSCCSAGAWLASTAGRVLLSSMTTGMGGLGFIAWMEKVSENIEVISSSELKAAQLEGKSSVRDAYLALTMTRLLQVLLRDMERNRKLNAEQLERLREGAIFYGQDAIDVGLADGFFSPFAWHSQRQIIENSME